MKYLHSPIQWAVHLLILPLILSAISCTSPGKIRERNRNNLSRLTLDMSRQQVLTVMKRPYRSETLSLSNGKRLELLYYHTDLKTPDGAVTDDELTPVVLIEDKVIGWMDLGPALQRGGWFPGITPGRRERDPGYSSGY